MEDGTHAANTYSPPGFRVIASLAGVLIQSCSGNILVRATVAQARVCWKSKDVEVCIPGRKERGSNGPYAPLLCCK